MKILQTPILLKGYHPDYNSRRDYKTAKKPISTSTGFTKPDYKPPSADICKNWIASGGWIGHLVPEGIHILDVEDPIKIKLIRDLCRQKEITPPINLTNNGVQFIFSTIEGPFIPGASKRMTRLGFPVTDRAALKNYVILPPTNGRTFENEDQLNSPPVIPDELLPAQNTTPDMLNYLAWELGAAYRNELLAGYDDLDSGFMALLISCKITEAQIITAYQLVFVNDFDERRTMAMYQRTKERTATGEPIQGIGSLVKSLKDKGLDSIVSIVTKLERLSGKSVQVNSEDEKKKRESKTDKLVNLALGEFDLFHDKDLKAYATIQKDEHSETYPLRSKAFRTRLSGLFWEQYAEGIGGQIVQDALGTLEGQAIHGEPCYPVYVRLAESGGNIYLDLGNEKYDVVEITPDGWTVLGNQNVVKFRRPAGMAALPYPKEGGCIEILNRYVNLANQEDWPLIVGFILGCFHPSGPYPILAVTGEQGSAKSTLLKVIKAITDPSTAPLRSTPKNLRDLAISANNSWALAFDNLSDIPGWLSDGLCRLATGGGLATRTLYTDDDETIFNVKRPVMLNGIDNVIRKHDLADRAIIISLGVIQEERRIPEKKFWEDFGGDSPKILGAILDAVSSVLKTIETIHLASHPRMADFAKWVTAAEKVLGWKEKTFLNIYRLNIREITSLTLDADLVGTAVSVFMEDKTEWKGTATELLDALENAANERTKKAKGWPGAPQVLSGKLKRSATALRTHKISVIFPQRTSKQKLIRLEKVGEQSVTSVTEEVNAVHHTEINNKSPMTLSTDRSVTGASCGHEQRQTDIIYDVSLDGDDSYHSGSVIDIPNKTEGVLNGYEAKAVRDDNDASTPPSFENDLREGII